MKLIYFVGLGLVVYLNLAAMTAAACRVLPYPAIARAAALVTVVTVFFFIGHFVGSGGWIGSAAPDRGCPLCAVATQGAAAAARVRRVGGRLPRRRRLRTGLEAGLPADRREL